MGSGIKVIKMAVFAANHSREHDTDVVHVCCPNETAEVQVYVWTNTIEWGGPTDVDHIVKWSGDLGDNPVINDHAGSYFEQYLYTRFRPGTHKVTASGSVGHKSVTVQVLQSSGTGVEVEIWINETESPNDDVVQVKSDHPRRMFKVPCQIRLKSSAAAPVRVDLICPSHRLLFFEPQNTKPDTLLTLDLPANGNWTKFEITGEKASEKKGDAEIEVFYSSEVVARKKVTVFSFDKAQIAIKQGGDYRLVKGPGGKYNYYVPGRGVAVSFSAKARLRPAGLDCNAPQIANLRVGIMQEVSALFHTVTYDTPTIAWDKDAKDKATIEVEKVRRWQQTFDPTVTQPVNDGVADNAPLYDYTDSAVKFPIGCVGAGAATSDATPRLTQIVPTISELFPNAEVTWTRLVNVTIRKQFRTFCVVFDQRTQKFCALRQAIWTVNVDSKGRPANQHAIVHADAAVSADPAMPPPRFETAPRIQTSGPVGSAKKKFTFEKKKKMSDRGKTKRP
jgi:hypothetical protein